MYYEFEGKWSSVRHNATFEITEFEIAGFYCMLTYECRMLLVHLALWTITYSRFQGTFQSAVAKFFLNIFNYVTKFGILRGNLLSKFASCWIKYWSSELKYWSSEVNFWSTKLKYWITKPRLPDYCIFEAKLLTMLFVFLCICLLFSLFSWRH